MTTSSSKTQHSADLILDYIGFGKAQSKEAEACLSKFASLGDLEKETARGLAIETVFTLAFGEDAVTEVSANFEKLRKAAWSKNCWLSPRIIITPSTAEQVSKVLALCRFLGAKFSIRGGGHLQVPGFNSNDGGVLIDTSKFKDVVVSEDKSTCDIGPGLRWLEVYEALDPYGVAVIGGRVATVGVSGLLLGGGLSFQNSYHGVSATGVVDYEVVLADSTIVHANAKENTDLFWALKGGCSNFGIVTKFKMTTIPNQSWAEARVYSPEQNDKLIEALMPFHEACEKDPKGSLIRYATQELIVLIFIYCAPVENPDVFKCFYDIPFQAILLEPKHRSVYEIVKGLGDIMTPGDDYIHEFRTMSSLPDLEVYKACEKFGNEAVETLKDVEGLVFVMTIQPIASGSVKASDARGGNPLGFPAKNHQWFLILADYKNPKDAELVHSVCRDMIDAVEAVAKKNGAYLPFQYSNYCAKDQNPLASYGTENLQKLKDIAIRYDPDGVFQTLQNGGWLV